jgi:hypothetical protein
MVAGASDHSPERLLLGIGVFILINIVLASIYNIGWVRAIQRYVDGGPFSGTVIRVERIKGNYRIAGNNGEYLDIPSPSDTKLGNDKQYEIKVGDYVEKHRGSSELRINGRMVIDDTSYERRLDGPKRWKMIAPCLGVLAIAAFWGSWYFYVRRRVVVD